MNDKDYVEARLIFNEFNGSHFFMSRNEVYKDYAKFNVPKKIEIIWAQDIRNNFINEINSEQNESKIANSFSRLSDIICQYIDINGLSFLIEFAQNNQQKFDSFSNLRIAESIINAIDRFDKKQKKSAIINAISLLRKIDIINFRVSDSYKENGVFPDYITKDKIIERIKRNIEYWEKLI
jgi:hypothetical protein